MDSYLGEIKCFGGNYAPRNWAYCDGRLLNISEYNALYSLLGTQYGGDGISNFALPDLRGRCPIGAGAGTGLTTRSAGDLVGSETVALSTHQIPNHLHTITNQTTVENTLGGAGTGLVKCMAGTGDTDTPVNNFIANAPNRTDMYTNSASSDHFNSAALEVNASLSGNLNVHVVTQSGNAGQSVAHNNMQPWECINYIICLAGVYPPRS